jgi:UDP-glucose 6-dehydrogenase
MKKEKHEKTTVTVRLTDEEDQVLRRLCMLKKTSKTGYLARLAKDQAKRELLKYAAEEYLEGKGSLSELAKKTGLDVPTIMDEVASIKGEDKRAVESFLSAVETLSKLYKDPEFYNLAVSAVKE